MRRPYYPFGHPKLAALPGPKSLDRLDRDAGPARESCVRLVPRREIIGDRHGDTSIATPGTFQDRNVSIKDRVPYFVKSVYRHGSIGAPPLTDEQLAREILNHLWPTGSRGDGARATGIAKRTFERICKGSGIKTENWVRLHACEDFEAEWTARNGESKPALDPTTMEVMGRLALVMGRHDLKVLAFELETLVRLLGAERTIETIETLADNARAAQQSASNAPAKPAGQKRRA